jgi:hypothetical protein
MKDSQFEGFKPLKFIRSPIVAALGTTLLVQRSLSPPLIATAAIGIERVLVEFYKTFLTRQVRGIHAGKPLVHPGWLRWRWLFAVAYVAGMAAAWMMSRAAR